MMENPNTSAVWIQLITTAGTIATLIITHILTRNRAAVREAKLDAVHETVAKTEVIINGKDAAKDDRIRDLEAEVRSLRGLP